MFSAAKTSGPSGVADPQFNYVTALLHGDGTNGAQNNTFVDSSSNAFTITRNGTPTQGSFSPYGTLWSNYFGGSPSSIFFPYASNLTFGSNNFTIECWVNPNRGSGNNSVISGIYDDLSSTPDSWLFYINTTGNLVLLISVIGNGIAILTSSTTVTNNVWSHVAVSRSGSNWYMYINGTQVSTASNSTSIVSGSANLGIGNFQNDQTASNAFVGYISNFRIVNGTALYTSAFTPSTTPLTAITNTVLLTCQSNRFVDNSSYNYTATTYGTPSVQRFNPFLPTSSQAYSTSVYGGSGYFNGSTDVLTVADNAVLQLGAGDFSIEFWMWKNSTYNISGSNFQALVISPTDVSNSYEIQTHGPSNTLALGIASVGNIVSYATSNFAPFAFYHIVFTRSSNAFRMFVNGVLVSYATNTINFASGSGTSIGGTSSSRFWDGYITDVRIIKGSIPTTYQTSATSTPTSVFTPPTAPLTAISGTSLLLSMQNAGIYDNAMINDLITVGSAQISTSVKKYGTGSLSFNGSTDYLQAPDSPILQLTGNFTIEFWMYAASTSSGGIITKWTSGNVGYFIGFGSSNSLGYYATAVGGGLSTTFSTTNTWTHVAVTRNGNVYTLWVNGVSANTVTTSTTNSDGGQVLNIGRNSANGINYYSGYLDDIRITNGYARYTSNFTLPTSAFPNY
jgi:hypothetical protein